MTVPSSCWAGLISGTCPAAAWLGGRRCRWLPPGVEAPVVPRLRWSHAGGWWSGPCLLGSFRRLSKDYEFLPATSEAVIHLAVIQLLVRRLASR